MPDTPNVAAPASGTYGQGVALERLKSSLPLAPAAPSGGGSASGAPPPPSVEPPLPTPAGPEGRPQGAGRVPPGIPSAVLGPTAYPGRPVNTPLQEAAVLPGVAAPDQARLAQLDALANHPNVSEDTRNWAKGVLELLIGREE